MAKGTPKKPQPPAVVYERYTLRAELAGWAIVLGLAVELGTLIAAGRPLSELIPQAIADVLIGGGVAFELLFGRRARIAGDSAQAEANARAAEAELRLGELQQSVARNAMPRQITSFEAFDNELKDVPPATVEILYESNVTDAFMLAVSLMAQLSMANWPIRSRSRLGAAALNTIPQEYIANDIPWPLIVEGRGSPWGIAIISNKQDRGSDPNDPANALQRAIFKAGADTSVGIGFDPKLPDNTLRVVVGDKTPSAPVIPTRIDATADPAKKQ